MQYLPRFAVTTELAGNQAALLLARLDDDGAGAIPEQHGGVALGPVQQLGQSLGTDHQHPLHHAGLHQGGGDREGIDEAGAGGVEVEHRCLVGAEGLLHGGGAIGDQRARCGGRG